MTTNSDRNNGNDSYWPQWLSSVSQFAAIIIAAATVLGLLATSVFLSTRVAIASDVTPQFQRLDLRIDRLDSKIDNVIARLNTKIDNVESRLTTKLDRIETLILQQGCQGGAHP